MDASQVEGPVAEGPVRTPVCTAGRRPYLLEGNQGCTVAGMHLMCAQHACVHPQIKADQEGGAGRNYRVVPLFLNAL